MGTRSAPFTRHPIQPILSVFRTYVMGTLDLLQTIAFWTAVTLPWVLVTFLLAGPALDSPMVFAALLATTLVSGIFGHNYGE